MRLGRSGSARDPSLSSRRYARHGTVAMGITRILDLIVIILLATILLMPRPDATVKPALTVDGERRERVAELQSILIGPPRRRRRQPRAGEHLSRRPPARLGAGGGDHRARFHASDYRLAPRARHRLRRPLRGRAGVRGGAAGDGAVRARRRSRPASRPATTPFAAGSRCCADDAGAIAHVDMKNAPYLAKERIFHELHPAFLPRPKAQQEAAAKAAKPGASSVFARRRGSPLTSEGARRQHPRQLCARSSTG